MRDVPAVLVTAARLLARHWPALLALAFLGVGLRSAVLWAAVEVSDVQGQLAQLLLILAPLGYLLPIVAMLHLCRGSLPRLTALDQQEAPQSPTEGRPRRLVDIAVSVLIPFLAVYVSYGLLEQDIERFRNEAAFAEFNRFSLSEDLDFDFQGRLGIYPVQIALMIVVVAWVLRWALGRIENRTHFLALAFLGALVEVYYTAQLAGQSLVIKGTGQEWLQSRRAVGWFEDAYAAVMDRIGFLADPVRALLGAFESTLGSFDAVVVVPIAWLTVGAVVLGHKLDDLAPKPSRRRAVEPTGLRALVLSFLRDLGSRWSAFWSGLRLLASAGLMPMLLFGLVFLVAIRLPSLVIMASRQVIGPVETDTWLAFSPIEASLALALSMAVTAPLLAAAVDWLVGARRGNDLLSEGPEAPRSPAGPTTAAPV